MIPFSRKTRKTSTKNELQQNWVYKSVASAPVALPAGLASFSTVAMLFLVMSKFQPAYIWPIGIAVAFLTIWLVGRRWLKVRRPGSIKEQRLCDWVVIIGVLLWVGVNIFFTAEQIFVNRDPGIYSVTGAWLTNNEDLHIQKSDTFGKMPGLQANSAGFGLSVRNSNELFAQGVHLLPAFLGLSGRIIGVGPMMHLNVLFGAAALLAVYAFGRSFLRPRWAVLATTTLSVSLPFLYFSRGMYTEPLAMALTFSALSLLWLAQRTKRLEIWFLTGLTLGAGTFTRIDAYLTIAAFEAFLVVMLALAPKGQRREVLYQAGALVLGTAITTAIGWLDLTVLSSGYYQAQKREIDPEILLITGIAALGLITVAISWSTRILDKLNRITRSWRSAAVAVLLVTGIAALVSRPLWYTGYIPALQGTETVIIRSYYEHSVDWVAWYLGPLIVIAGLAGLVMATYKALHKRDLLLVAPILVVLGTALLYFVRPSIYPDQIWASRRFLPVVMPGLAVFSGFALDRLYRHKFKRPAGMNSKLITTVVATLILIAPLFISYPFLFTRSYVPQLTQLRTVCDSLPEKSAVLWVGDSSLRAVQSSRAFCEVPSMGYGHPVTKTFLIEMAKNAQDHGNLPVVGVFGDQLFAVEGHYISPPIPVSTIRYSDLEQGRRGPPRSLVTTERQIYLGVVRPDGAIVPLTSR